MGQAGMGLSQPVDSLIVNDLKKKIMDLEI